MTKASDTADVLKSRFEEQKIISKLGEIALSGVELNELMDIAVKELSGVLDIKYAKILELLPNEEKFLLRAGVGWKKKYVVGESKIDATKNTQAGYTLLSKKALIVNDLRKEKRFKGHRILHDHGIVSGISVIIMGTRNTPYGILTAHSDKPRQFTKQNVIFIQSLANIIGLAVQRRDSERFLILNQERFEHAQKAGRIGIFDWDILNNKLWWSDEQAILFGHEAGYQPTLRTGFSENIYPPDIEKIREDTAKAKELKKDYLGEFRLVQKDGTLKWIGTRGKFYFDTSGNAVRLLGINYDINERKKNENASIFLSEASKILSSSLDINKTLKSVADIAITSVADWCSIDLLNREGEIELLAVAHKDPEKIKWAKRLRKEYPPDMKAPTGLPNVLRTGKPEFYPLISEEMIKLSVKDPKLLKILDELGLTALIIAPLKIKGKVIGAMSFVSAESKTKYTKRDLQIAEQIADRASVAIENSLLYQDVNTEKMRLNNLISNVPGVVWEIWGAHGSKNRRTGFISKYVQEIVGYSPDEWYKNPNFGLSIIHPADQKRAIKEATTIFKNGTGGTSRFRWISKEGKSVWVESKMFVIKGEGGKSIGMRGVIMDISDRVEIERRKDEFISMASHELKTPLTSSKVFAYLLAKDLKNGKEKSSFYLSKVDEQIDRLSNLVDDLLDISKIQAGKLELRRKKFYLKDFIDKTVSDMRLITEENIILGDIDNQLLFADRDRLSQVLINLLSNAIKYSPQSARIEVQAKRKGNEVIVSVKDEGLGISKEHQAKIFDRFYRVYDNIDRTFPGLGMGLYISSQIVRRHEGQIWLKSEAGKGSVFYFSIPLRRARKN